MLEQANLCLIFGSDRRGHFDRAVAHWIRDALKHYAFFAVSSVDPLDGRTGQARNELLDTADAFVVVTPEYNHSFPAPLKAIVDAARQEWYAKPVAFVSYGGSASGGIRAVEHLRAVFASLHAVSVREQVALTRVHKRATTEDGRFVDLASAEAPFRNMMRRLMWWIDVLRSGTAAAQAPGCARQHAKELVR